MSTPSPTLAPAPALAPTLASSLLESAAAVAALGETASDIAILDEASVVAGMGVVRDHRRALQAYELALAASIARFSDHTLGYQGLARRNGSATPAIFIQSVTGSSIEEATKLARLGQAVVDAEDSGVEQTPVAVAVVAGDISVDAADAIRRGLGHPDTAVTAEQLAAVAGELIDRAAAGAGAMTPEALLKAARQARNDLDLDAVERGEKQRSMLRYVRVWKRDGMSGGSWALPDEDGGLEIYNAMKLLVAKKTNGPRFADVTKETPSLDSNDVVDSAGPSDSTPSGMPAAVLEDDRTPEHIMADGFAQIFHNGLTTNPSIVPGAGRAPVRVIVPANVLKNRVTNGPEATPAGSALLEETMTAISFNKLSEYLCEGGTTSILIDDHGRVLDAGREQRLFTRAQRTALGVRDGGCRHPGCDKPPSWCEAHHINYWAKDNGTTNIANGILLCRYHHMLTHNRDWQIIHDTHGRYWLKPPKEQDPHQRLTEMPSNNPLIAALTHTRQTDQTLAS